MVCDLISLYEKVFGQAPAVVKKLSGDGSNRVYYRMSGDAATVIGAEGTSLEENRAFCVIAKQFEECGIDAPRVLAVSHDGMCYLLQDLGAFWERETGTPIPLGIAVTKRTLGAEVIMQVESEIRESLRIARGRENLVTPFIDEKAQIDDFSVMEAHIRMFVNDFSENVGESGKRALENLWRLVRGE